MKISDLLQAFSFRKEPAATQIDRKEDKPENFHHNRQVRNDIKVEQFEKMQSLAKSHKIAQELSDPLHPVNMHNNPFS